MSSPYSHLPSGAQTMCRHVYRHGGKGAKKMCSDVCIERAALDEHGQGRQRIIAPHEREQKKCKPSRAPSLMHSDSIVGVHSLQVRLHFIRSLSSHTPWAPAWVSMQSTGSNRRTMMLEEHHTSHNILVITY